MLLKYLYISIGKTIRRVIEHYLVYKKFGIYLPKLSSIKSHRAIVIGGNFSIAENCKIYCHDPDNGSTLEIGNDVALNTGVTINADCGGVIIIGNGVLIGQDVVIRAANHKFNQLEIPIREQGHEQGKICIEDDVWLGAKVIVLPNVNIGRGSIIGAGSVVNSDIPPYSVAAGIPAKVIRNNRSDN